MATTTCYIQVFTYSPSGQRVPAYTVQAASTQAALAQVAGYLQDWQLDDLECTGECTVPAQGKYLATGYWLSYGAPAQL